MEKLDQPLHKIAKNKDGKTPWQLFKDEHKEMIEQAIKGTKDTSRSFMVVATGILTVTFAVALTVPGGNDQNKGTPLLVGNDSFRLFLDVVLVAFVLSIVSMMLLLTVLRRGNVEEDFLERLPEKLLTLLSYMLSLAMLSTEVAFILSISLGSQRNGKDGLSSEAKGLELLC